MKLKYSFLILFCTLLMTIGYATVSSITLGIQGIAVAQSNGKLFITQTKYKSNNNANIEDSKITYVYNTLLNSSISLSKTDATSSITYEITIHNNSDFYYVYKGYIYEEECYSNENIIIEVSDNLTEGYILKDKTSITFTITYKYKDGININNTDNVLNSIIKFKFHYIDKILNLSDPQFDSTGMIPITISNNGSVKTADLEEDWYNYSEKRWANIALVKSSARHKYLGVESVDVTTSDILAYFVWIPRFKYKIWSISGSSSSSPQTIDIVFENKDTITNGTKVGDYITHKAFWWDDNNNETRNIGEELSGIWVGKFELSSNSDNNPTILPNKSSIVSQTISKQFETVLKLSGGTINTSTGAVAHSGSDIYGLAPTTNSHMIKNIEWGAMAYLSHSKYGIGKEIRINNYYNSAFKTGCGASSNNAATSTTCSIEYGNATTYPQSTTENITGIFDTSGGGWDRVMGNYNNIKGDYEFTSLPERKYYDVFNLTSLSACTLETCGGQALYETSEWYSDLSNFISSNTYPWIVRSGGHGDKENSGIFNFGRNVGQATNLSTTRAVLITK